MDKLLLEKYFKGEPCTEEELLRIEEILDKSGGAESFFYDGWRQAEGEVEEDLSLSMWKNIGSAIPSVPLWKRSWVKIAAAASVLVAAVSVYLVIGRTSAPSAPIWTTYTAPVGKMQRILLPDSSIVYLNAGSSLKISSSFNDSNRDIYVEGEAFCDVHKDVSRPFIAYGGGLKVQVLGTSFDIKAFKGDVNASVSVASGKVSVSDGAKQLGVLTPDQSLVIDQQSRAWARMAMDHQDMEWFNDRMAFVDLSFGDIARMLERKYGVSIAFAREDLKQCRYSGRFEHFGLSEILKQLSWTNRFTYNIKGKNILVDGKGCK